MLSVQLSNTLITWHALDISTNSFPTKKERIKTVFFFALWGPLIGALPAMVFIWSTTAGSPGVDQILGGAVSITAFSYVLGILPAVLSGLLYQWYLYRPLADGSRAREVIIGFVSGYSATAILLFLLSSFFEPRIDVLLLLGSVGGFSGAVCSYLDKRRRQKIT